MGRKRKSQSISEDDVIDLSLAYGVEQEPPSLPTPAIAGSCADHIPSSARKKIRIEDDRLRFKFQLADAMSQATRSLDESARSMEMQKQQPPTRLDHRCTRCNYMELNCNLQRPICGKCRELRAEGSALPCTYFQDFHQHADGPHAEALARSKSFEHPEVEVIDLGSDSDDNDSGNREEYEVEAIIARRSSKKTGVEYMVKWKGYSYEASTWEPVSNLDGAQALIDEYETTIASTLISMRKKDQKSNLKRSPSLGLVVVPRNPKVLEHQISRPIPEFVRSVDACRLVPVDDTYEYLVRWKGLAPNQDSWEAESRFEGCRSIIQDYHLATCLDFPDDTEKTTDHSGTDTKLISAGIQVIVCSGRAGSGPRLEYTFYDKEQDNHFRIPASELVSNEAQRAILLFFMRSKIMQEHLGPYTASALNSALTRHGIPSPARAILTSHSMTADGQELDFQNARLTGRTPEISAVINHRLRAGKSLEYLVRWKYCKLDSWHSAEILSGLPDGILATRRYLETVTKGFVQRSPPATMPNGGSNTTTRFDWGATMQQTRANDNMSRLQKTSGRNQHRQSHDDTSQNDSTGNAVTDTHLFQRPLVGKEKLPTVGAASKNISIDLGRVGVPEKVQRQAGSRKVHEQTHADEEWINEHINRAIAVLSEEVKTKIRREIAKSDDIVEVSVKQKIDPLFAFLRNIAEKELKTMKAKNSNKVNHKSKGQARDSSYASAQTSQSGTRPSTQPSSIARQSSMHGPMGSSSVDRKNRYYEDLKKSFESPKDQYPKEDRYLLVKKTDTWVRPLPNGLHDQHNIASNVLLTIDRGAGGRKINSVGTQVSNSEKFKGYKAPTSMSEMTEANIRATLPMGGKSL